jgi:hypothetical protein
MGNEMGRLLNQVWPGLQSEQLIGWSIFQLCDQDCSRSKLLSL